jgi:cytoskeleton protein RodZ
MSEQQELIPLGTGERLRKARVRRKQTVEDVARALKVPEDVVLAIETDQLERFARIYRQGYVRAYAELLGFAAEEVAAIVGALESPEPELQPIFEDGGARRHGGDRWLRAASYMLGSLLIGTLVWQLTHEAVRLSQGDPERTDNRGAPGAVTAESSGRGPERADGADTHVNASIAALEEISRRRAATGSDAGRQAWDALRSNQAPDTDDPTAVELHHLRVTTSGDSWVEIVDARGQQLELDLVRGGSVRDYHGEAPFRVLIGRASAVDLFLDGSLVDTSEHTSGNVTQMSLEADSAAASAADAPDAG